MHPHIAAAWTDNYWDDGFSNRNRWDSELAPEFIECEIRKGNLDPPEELLLEFHPDQTSNSHFLRAMQKGIRVATDARSKRSNVDPNSPLQNHSLDEEIQPSNSITASEVMVETVANHMDPPSELEDKVAGAAILAEANRGKQEPLRSRNSRVVLKIPRLRSMPPGHSAMGISALSVHGGKVGSLEEPDVQLRMDSGADITLISEEFLKSLSIPLKVKRGLKLRLYELTNAARLIGYVWLKIFMPRDDGTWLEFDEEAYVIPGMKVPILLGEDFHVNYQISVLRSLSSSKLSIPYGPEKLIINASSSPNPHVDFRVLPSEIPEVQNRKAYLACAKQSSEKSKNGESRKKCPPKDHYVRASKDIQLKPESSSLVPISGHFEEEKEWFVEKIVVHTPDGSFFSATNCLVSSDNPRVSVANPSNRVKWVRRGDILGILHKPEDYLDQETSEEDAKAKRAYALAVQKIAEGSLQQKESTGKQMSNAKSPGVMEDPEEEHESWGPSKLPEVETMWGTFPRYCYLLKITTRGKPHCFSSWALPEWSEIWCCQSVSIY